MLQLALVLVTGLGLAALVVAALPFVNSWSHSVLNWKVYHARLAGVGAALALAIAVWHTSANYALLGVSKSVFYGVSAIASFLLLGAVFLLLASATKNIIQTPGVKHD